MNDEIYSEVFDEGLFLHSSTLCVEKFTNWKTFDENDMDNFSARYIDEFSGDQSCLFWQLFISFQYAIFSIPSFFLQNCKKDRRAKLDIFTTKEKMSVTQG